MQTILFLLTLTVGNQTYVQDSEAWVSMTYADYTTCQEHPLFVQIKRNIKDLEYSGDFISFSFPETTLNVLSVTVQEILGRPGAWVFHASQNAAHQNFDRLGKRETSQVEYIIDRPELVQVFLNELEQETLRETILSLSGFTNRYYKTNSGAQAAEWIFQKWSDLARTSSNVQVEKYNHTGFNQPSVILTIHGTSRESQAVILGGHLDSIVSGTVTESTLAPGADDNASGIACLTELIRVCMEQNYQPEYTIHFMAFAAEEVGLRGSSDIAGSFFQENRDVLGMLQLDMTNYYGPAEDVTFISDYTDENQNAFLMTLIDTYLDLSYTSSPCGYGCSDHYSWNVNGYPASFPFETKIGDHNPNIHSANDTLENCGNQTDKALDFTHLAATFMLELGKGTLTDDTPPGPEIRWIPHVTRSTGGFSTRYLIFNASERADIQFFGYNQSGEMVERVTRTYSDHTYISESQESLFSQSDVSHFSIFGPTTCQIVATYTSLGERSASAHVPESGVIETKTHFFTAEWDVVFDGIALINTGSEPIEVVLSVLPEKGIQQDLVLISDLAPKAKLLSVLGELFENIEPDTLVTVTCNGPFSITVLRGTAPDQTPGFLYQTVPLSPIP